MKKTIQYFLFGLIGCFCHLTMPAQNRNIDSLLTLLKTDKLDTNKVKHLCQLTHECELSGEYQKGLSHGNAALELAYKLNFKKGIAQADNNLGNIYLTRACYTKALDFYLEALKYDEQIKNKTGITTRLSNIGIVYMEEANYPKALDYYFKALKIAEELCNKKLIEICQGNIGVVYQNQALFPRALEYYFKALAAAKEIKDDINITRWLGNIGVVYSTQENYSKSLEYYFKALKMAEELKNKILIAIDVGNIGVAYNGQKNYSNAIMWYFKALKMREEIGAKNLVAATLGNIGSLYIATGKFKEAEQYIKRAISINENIGELKQLMDDQEFLSHLYDTIGQPKLALIHFKKATALKDTIYSQENKKQLIQKEMNYEFDKKETAAKAEQDKKDAVTAQEKQKQKIIIYSVSVSLFLTALLALFVFRGYNQKQKDNVIITSQKTEVEKQRELLEKKNTEITDSINYAKRIQQAKLPKKEEIYDALPQCFVLFKPKDIVSGDFYFFHKNEANVFIASADCTGHGVPGAFMSMIASEKLEDAVSQTEDTSGILKLLNKGIKNSLHQSETSDSTRDGMDIALAKLDLTGFQNPSGITVLHYAGANRPIWIIRKGQKEIEEIKATKKAIGGFTDDSQHFNTHEIKLQPGDTFYIFTDGYSDQFGGEAGKKLMTSKFKEILLSIQVRTMQEQEKHLDAFIENWRGSREQIDDILVIGVRV